MYHVLSRVLEILDISERITSWYVQLEAIENKHTKEANLRENRLQSKTDVIHDTSAELSVSALPPPPLHIKRWFDRYAGLPSEPCYRRRLF